MHLHGPVTLRPTTPNIRGSGVTAVKTCAKPVSFASVTAATSFSGMFKTLSIICMILMFSDQQMMSCIHKHETLDEVLQSGGGKHGTDWSGDVGTLLNA